MEGAPSVFHICGDLSDSLKSFQCSVLRTYSRRLGWAETNFPQAAPGMPSAHKLLFAWSLRWKDREKWRI